MPASLSAESEFNWELPHSWQARLGWAPPTLPYPTLGPPPNLPLQIQISELSSLKITSSLGFEPRNGRPRPTAARSRRCASHRDRPRGPAESASPRRPSSLARPGLRVPTNRVPPPGTTPEASGVVCGWGPVGVRQVDTGRNLSLGAPLAGSLSQAGKKKTA